MQKSDPFGGAQPIDSKKAAETRQKLLEEKVSPCADAMAHILFSHAFSQAKLDASRRSEVQPAHEQPAKQDKDMPRQQVAPRSLPLAAVTS
jgi:hypothetical protein